MSGKQPAIVLLGPTGSGKTPLGEMFERLGFNGRACVHFDFGQNLREAARRREPDEVISARDIEFLRGVLEGGVLLEDRGFPIAERLLLSFLRKRHVDGEALVVMNGLPRHVGQARALKKLLHMDEVVLLQCSHDVIRQRISRNTGGDRSRRTDDDADAVERKLEIHAQRTAPLVHYFRDQEATIHEIQVTAGMKPDEMWHRLDGA